VISFPALDKLFSAPGLEWRAEVDGRSVLTPQELKSAQLLDLDRPDTAPRIYEHFM
jgi:hypothetical protein